VVWLLPAAVGGGITSQCCGRPRVASKVCLWYNVPRRVALAATDCHPFFGGSNSVRTVLAHLWDTTESAVTAVLDAAYLKASGPSWTVFVGEDPCLYINIYRHGSAENPDWATHFDGVGGHPAVSVSADISGRHNGWPQVDEFMGLLLGRFRGLAEDDNSHQLWSLAQLRGEGSTGQRFGEYWRDWG
jgi:hypothetical protein